MPLSLHDITPVPSLDLLRCRSRRLTAWKYARYQHVPYWRLYWNNRPGAQMIDTMGQRHYVGPNHFTLVAPNTVLANELLQPVEHFFFHFIVGMPLANIKSHVHTCPAPQHMVSAMRSVYIPDDTDQPDMQRLIIGMTLCWYALSTLPTTLLPTEPEHWRIEKILNWWKSQNWRKVSNHALAVKIGMHPAAFCRYFHRIMGYPPHKFGMIKRIEQACQLLHFSNLSIEQIAEQTEFGNRYYFSRKFHEIRKISPVAFRRKNTTQKTG